ncbi:MAG TPA: bifunctional folylpolyglutamate synthase/dihydrofolate synthase [Elusimicrobia bacterium]|nr:bifunctional folylpolyglutamate synthase/dihydrofolate synthase [Elusimicrobiota bacterium]
MDYAKALEFLDLRRETLWNLGLERIRIVSERLGNPHRAFPCVHVAGTNGKGSFCALLASVLKEAGHKTGLYVSPHLCEVRERIQVDGGRISKEDFGRALAAVREAETEPATYFEALTAAAFLHFREAKSDVAVVESGLGGRLDATNVLERPLLSVVTSIGLDHQEHLGGTLAAIAGEKAGIFKRGSPCLIGEEALEPRAVLEARARELGCQFHGRQTRLEAVSTDWERGFQEVEGPFGRCRLGLLGSAALGNAGLVCDAAGLLRERGLDIPDEALRRGLERVRWPGRFQVVQAGGRPLVLDGAHNPAAMERFVSTWTSSPFSGRRSNFIIGMLADKDHESMVRLLAPHLREAIVVRPDSPRALEPESLAARLRAAGCPKVAIARSPAEALGAWLQSGAEAGAVCGSFYLVGGVLRALGRLP